MGYYVEITNADFLIPTENLQAAYEAACELNNDNSKKRGGSYPLTEEEKKAKGPHPKFWFSWMDWNYHETCKNIKEILDGLGFYTEETEDGVTITGYDNKTGQEELFLKAIAPFVKEGSKLDWIGESGEYFRHTFTMGTLKYSEGNLVF